MILYHDLIHDPDTPGWFIILGQNTEYDDHPVRSVFPMDALQWRSVEFGVPKDDIETLFKMVFAEGLNRFHGDGGHGEARTPIPVETPIEEALRQKQEFMQEVSARQNALMKVRGVAPKVDRVDLLDKLTKHLPNGIGGVDLEEKKVVMYASRGGTPDHVLTARKAMALLQEGATEWSEAAIAGGSYLSELDKQIARRTE